MDPNGQSFNRQPNQLIKSNADHQQVALYAGGGSADPFEDDEVIDLREYWNTIVRRKWTVIFFALVVVVTAVLATSLMTPIYRSSVTLQIEKESTKVVEYTDVTPEESGNDFYQTQYELLKSRTLARRVIDQLGLDSASQLSGKQETSYIRGLITSLKQTFSSEQSAASENNLPPDLESMFLKSLTVTPIRNSRLVVVHFDSPDKQLAANVVNALAKNYINTNLERRFDASSYAKTFLSERLKQVRANLEDSERKLVAYAKDLQIIDLDQKQGVLMQKVQGLTANIVAAESARIKAESEFEGMRLAGGEGFIKVLDSPVVQRYKETLAGLESEYEEKLRIYKPVYPSMVQLRSQIDELQQRVQSEIHNIIAAVESNFKATVREEALLKAKMAELKNEILELQNRSTDYQTLKRDVETNRKLYDGLLQRMKEIGVAAGVGTNNISVVDPGEMARFPIKPNLTKNLLIALVLGLFGGVGLAFLFEHLDDTIKSATDLERLFGLAPLGIIPEVDSAREGGDTVWRQGHSDTRSAFAEAYRSCRTALSFSTGSGAPKLLHITSAVAGEGKTTSAISLAVAFSQTGAKVLIIDADLRNPSLHKELSLPNSVGLTNLLAGDHKPSELIQRTEVANLYCLPSGPIPPNPAELLATGRMLDFLTISGKKFDHIIVDGPPVLGLADALVLANMAKTTILAVNAGETRKGALEGSIKRLRHAQANIVGSILTKYAQGGSGYGYDYHYSYNYYSYSGDDEAEQAEAKKLAS